MPKIVFHVPEGLLLVVWSSVGLWGRLVCGSKVSLCDGLGWVSRLVGWVGLKKMDPRTTLRHDVPLAYHIIIAAEICMITI